MGVAVRFACAASPDATGLEGRFGNTITFCAIAVPASRVGGHDDVDPTGRTFTSQGQQDLPTQFGAVAFRSR